MYITSRLIIALVIFNMLTAEMWAQGVCVPRQLKVTSTYGKVIPACPKCNEPIDGVSITLYKDTDERQVVVRTTTDAGGRFSLGRVGNGKYILVAEKPLYERFVFPIRVSRPHRVRNFQDVMVIHLGTDVNAPCGGGYAEFRKNKT